MTKEYTPAQAKEALTNAIKGYLMKDDKGDYLIEAIHRNPLLLMGMPGIGKTQMVGEVAKELELGFVSYSLTHMTRNSVLGLPIIKDRQESKYTSYTVSEIIAAVEEQVEAGQTEGILLLDEFTCISESIAPVMLAFLQTKNIGQHYLPQGWIIVACANPPEANKSAKRLDDATLDRLRLICVRQDKKDFIEYAIERKLHPAIISFHKTYEVPLTVNETEDSGTKSLVTYRGWENLSKAILVYERLGVIIDDRLIYQYIKDEKICEMFMEYYTKFGNRILTEEMVERILKKDKVEEIIYEMRALSKGEIWKEFIAIKFYFANKLEKLEDEEEIVAQIDAFYRFAKEWKDVGIRMFVINEISRLPKAMRCLYAMEGKEEYKELIDQFFPKELLA